MKEIILEVAASDNDCSPHFGDVCKYSISGPDQTFAIDQQGVIEPAAASCRAAIRPASGGPARRAQRQKQASTAAITKTPVAKQTKSTSVMMSKCDICTRFGLQCARANKHCRRQGHQNTRQGFLESKIKKGHIGDVKFFENIFEKYPACTLYI